MIRRGFLLLMLFPAVVFADHLPANKVAAGRAESTLAGINIHKSRAKELIEKFGKPDSYKKYPETEEQGEIVWKKDGAVIHATINVDEVAYAVVVSGKPNASTRTGAGLELGGSLADLEKVYGRRFGRRGDVVTVQWRDGTEMRVTLTGGRIATILLLAEVE